MGMGKTAGVVIMKKGDLVGLSAYGKKINKYAPLRDKLGMVMLVRNDTHFDIKILWPHRGFTNFMSRKDIKIIARG